MVVCLQLKAINSFDDTKIAVHSTEPGGLSEAAYAVSPFSFNGTKIAVRSYLLFFIVCRSIFGGGFGCAQASK